MVMLKSGNKIFVADFFRHYRYKTYKNPFLKLIISLSLISILFKY